MTLTPAWLDELRARTLLSALIGKTTKLQRAGREWKACCPFHNEKTPSFTVNDDKGFYHCFGCGAHGDAIRWMTDQRGLPFMDAVKELAQAAGLEVPAQDPRAREKAERASTLHDAMKAAEHFFEEQLGGLDGHHARDYLKRRGVTDAQRRAFGIGFAPDSRSKLRTALRDFGDDRLIECGLLIRPEEAAREPYDRFRGRLMIPIRDARGRTIAFGGRILGEGEPKYLNSPETALFDKGRTLFNLDRAAAASRKAGRVIVVEGYMDVIALDGAGIEEAVAPLGTALTEGQLERLWRLDPAPILCFDGDAAGQKAAIRAAGRAYAILKPGQSLSFARLPNGKDPDDLLRESGREAIEEVLASVATLADTVWHDALVNVDRENPDSRAALKVQLEQFADSNLNLVIASEYKRTFRSRFFDAFGWKRDDLKVIAGAVLKTRSYTRKPVFEMLVRAALLGLSRHPSLISKLADTLSSLRIEDPELAEWRDRLLNAAIVRPNLDSDAIEAILQSLKLSARQNGWLTQELRYSFLRKLTEADDAQSQLQALIEALNEGQQLSEEMRQLNERAIADTSGANYEAIESERRIVRAAETALRERCYQIGALK
ncbi:MAG TPA: DNA primase, partial [Sphingomicrobium sp.]|nr:DNA primase [Sphingomicrobium sp.]